LSSRDRHRIGNARASDEHVDLVLGHELARIAAGGGGIGRVVEHDQLHLAAGELRMLGDGRADALLIGNAERRDRPRQRADEADLEIGRRGLCGRQRDGREADETCEVLHVQGTSFH
jgi:hypothetical protein